MLAEAQSAPALGAIYRCVGRDGKIGTRDRPMTDCVGEQYFVNPDGSNNRVVPRPPTEEEREEAEQKQREEHAAQREAQVQARADVALVKRFPDKASHDLAGKAALDTARADIRASNARIADLMLARKPLLDEAEFYPGKPLPSKLKAALDANDASLAAQKSSRQNLDAEVDRINKNYDLELARLMKLWAARPVR
ncbi:MAG: hypothetical protein M3Y22_01390 [Pseudomonadota bacterium]|nr:hypothetical protein [Pseudomonadota bacterium]